MGLGETMRLARRKSWLATLCALGLCAFFPAEARADAINLGFVAVAGVVVLVPLTLFVVLVEGIFLAFGLRVPYRQTLRLLLTANLASLAAGVPVKIFNAWMYSQILPHPLAAYFRDYPTVAILCSANFFVVTLVVEFLVVIAWCRKRALPVGLGRVALFVFLANLATYAVLAPAYYFVARPAHDIREFTDDSKWACAPPNKLFFVDGEGHLSTVMTDGRGSRTVLPDIVRDYQYLPGTDVFLYRDGSNNLSLFRESEGKPRLCWKTNHRFAMAEVACDPKGEVVAYLNPAKGESMPLELTLHDMASGRSVGTGIITDKDAFYSMIAWADKPSTLLLKTGATLEAITFDGDMKATRTPVGAGDVPLLRVYGRFGEGGWWGRDDWGASFSSDQHAGMEVFMTHGLGSNLRVEAGGASFRLADNPGLLKLGNRNFNDACFLGNGKELVFDDYHDIYLLDVKQRKVGRIAEGTKFMLLDSKFQRTIK